MNKKNWKYLYIDDCATVVGGGTPSTKNPEYWDGNISWISPKDLSNNTNKYVSRGERFITQKGLENSSAKILPENSLLFSSRAPIGYLAINTQPIATNQGFKSLILKDEFDVEFFYYLFKQKTDYIKNFSSGSTFQEISGSEVKNLKFLIPPYKEQKQISKILSKLDKKIELNQKMNGTLDEIAKTLFKSWFIDFDPVRAKAEGRSTGLSKKISDLFPDSFEDSELGEIPKGWKLSNLDSNLEFVLGGDWGKEETSDDFNKEVVCIRGADIPNIQTFIESNPPKRFIKESSLQKRKLKEGDLVLEISGGSPTQSTGRTVYITEEFLSTQDCPVVFSNFCRILRSDSTLSKYIYYYLRCLYDSDKLFQYETGTTGIKNFGYKYFSEEVSFALPNFDLLKIFNELIETFLIKKGTNLKEIITLTNLRDILLPKLISGELKIPDAENFIKEESI